MKNSAVPILLALLGVAVVGGGIVYFVSQSKPKAPPGETKPGYTILPNCAGITITGQSEAMKFAQDQGKQAEVFTGATSTAWVAKAAAALGVPLICAKPGADQQSMIFGYKLFRAYARGANEADPQKIDVLSATGVLGYLRNQAITFGVPAAELPEGLG